MKNLMTSPQILLTKYTGDNSDQDIDGLTDLYASSQVFLLDRNGNVQNEHTKFYNWLTQNEQQDLDLDDELAVEASRINYKSVLVPAFAQE